MPLPPLSFCIVNTEQRELLLRCLDAIGREVPDPARREVIVLDNASTDGSATAARNHATAPQVIRLEQRDGWSANVNRVLEAASNELCVLLNEDAEITPGCLDELHAALEPDARAAMAAPVLVRPDGTPQASAWRFPSPLTALASLLVVGRRTNVQSRGDRVRVVDWAQSCTLLLRRSAVLSVGGWDPEFFVYSDEVDVQKRLRDAGWHTLYVPSATSVHHEQLSTGNVPERRIVEFSRNRDRYMRKHHTAAAAALVRWLTAATYAVRALAATALPGHDPRRYWRHATATLHPERGEGLKEAAAELNHGRRRL